jgi:hypothetical protein
VLTLEIFYATQQDTFMCAKYIVAVILMAVLGCLFLKKGSVISLKEPKISFLEGIENTIYGKCRSIAAWIAARIPFLNTNLSIEKKLRQAILADDEARAIKIILSNLDVPFLEKNFHWDDDSKESSVLIFAINNRKERMALELLSYWCHSNVPDSDGHTALYYARKLRMYQVIRVLENRKAIEM